MQEVLSPSTGETGDEADVADVDVAAVGGDIRVAAVGADSQKLINFCLVVDR